MDNHEILIQYGLTAKQADIYLAALALGTCSITQLAKKAGLKRPTAYLIIDELLKKRLLIAIPSGKITHYKAEAPEKLLSELDAKKEEIKSALPDLQAIYQKNLKQPKIRYYEGKDKLYQVYEEIFKAKEIWALFSYDKFSEVFTEKDNRHFFNILIRSGGVIHDLFENTLKARRYLSAGKYRTGVSESKLLPNHYKVATDILVFDGKTAMISFDNLLAVVIEDADIAASQKTMIQSVWDNSKS